MYEGNVEPTAVEQSEKPTVATVPVTVETPVRTQELPSRLAGLRTITLTQKPVKVLGNDPRRKRATLHAWSDDIQLGTSPAEADPTAGAYGAQWPQDIPLLLDTQDEIWAASFTSAGTKLTIIQEAWAL